MAAIHELLRSACLFPLAFLLACSGDANSGEPAGGDVPAADAPAAQTPGGEAAPQPGAPYQNPQDTTPPSQQAHDVSRMGYDDGDAEEAVVRVIEFSDFGCVHCATFHTQSYPELHREFIATGDVLWKYIPISIGGFPNGELAAVAGECAGEQGRFAGLRDRLFEIREEWMAAEDPITLFEDHAERVGLDRATFSECLQEGEGARRRIADQNQIAIQAGVRATPTFIVQGQPVEGAPPLEMFQEALREIIAEIRGPGR